MRTILALTIAAGCYAQPIWNVDDLSWKSGKNGSKSIVLREDAKSGGLELLVTYPSGHVFAPHWHESNERILLREGELSLGEKSLKPGGYAFLPAKEVQRLSCVSKVPCVFYVAWDGPPRSRAPERVDP